MEKSKFRVFDQVGFSRICGDDATMKNQLMSIINRTIENDLSALQSVVNQRNITALKYYLHHLKGTLSGIGQTALFEFVKQIESRSLTLNTANLLTIFLLIEKLKVLNVEMAQYSKMK